MPDLAPQSPVSMVESLEELVQLLNLATVRFYELSAQWDDTIDPKSDEVDEDASTAPDDEDPSAEPVFVGEFRTAFRKRIDGIDYRVSVRVPRSTGDIVVDAAAMYVAPTPFDTTREVLMAFGEMVAAMTILPYLRQAVMDLSIRITPDEPVVVPMIQRGAITFGLEDDDDDSDS